MIYNELKLTDNIKNIKELFNRDINKKYFEISNSDVLLQILCDEYQFLTCNLYSLFYRPNVPNYTIPYISNYNEILTIKNNNTYINDYIFYPVGKYYRFGINSAFYYFYLNIIEKLPKKSDVVIVQVIGPWEIYNNELHLYFELENILEKINNCKVRTVFLLITYGEKIKYDKIIIDNSENLKKDYIIINCDNFNNFNNIKEFIGKTDNIFIDIINLYSTKSCYNEIASLPFKILLYDKLLECLNVNGNLFINNKTYLFYKPIFQFLNIIYEQFSNFEILKNNIVFLHFGILKFENLKNKINNLFTDIINIYIDLDPYLGQNFLPKTKNNLLYCIDLEKNINIPNKGLLIKSINKNKISSDLINSFNKAYKDYNKLIKNYYNKYIFIINNDINKKNINKILINNIHKCIEYCVENNIEINDIYNNLTIPNKLKIVKKYFPKKSNINYNKLEISIDSIFSISNTIDMIRLSKLIISNNNNIKYIIDGNSNIGVGSIVFSNYFKKVYAVEYAKNTFLILKNNINVYKLKNTFSYHDDIIRFMNDKKILSSINYNKNSFCLFLDPPWSGYFYKIEKNVDLYLNNINIIDLLVKLNIKYIYIKVPYNFNFSYLYNKFENITIYKFNQYYIIYIIKDI
jgi:16S rRNA G966 N2-methylase RsmD